MTTQEKIEQASELFINNYLKSSSEYPCCDSNRRKSLILVDLHKVKKIFAKGMAIGYEMALTK
jgi:hypothetical protein